eukprot:2172817-Pyramimonas_sp.AAC.1
MSALLLHLWLGTCWAHVKTYGAYTTYVASHEAASRALMKADSSAQGTARCRPAMLPRREAQTYPLTQMAKA